LAFRSDIHKDPSPNMSSRTSSLAKMLALVAGVAAMAVHAGGCNLSLTPMVAADDNAPTNGLNEVDSGSADGAADAQQDAAPDHDMAPSVEGSPLCNASHSSGTCYPDDPSTSTAKQCHLAPDGGPYDLGANYADASLACHVVDNGGPITTECTPAGYGTDGMQCTKGTDCAPGYECVGTGTCQHYCCDDLCPGGPSVNGNDLFCDIQAMTQATSTKVPVCMLVHPCQLLGTDCGDTQTCSVVRSDGTTSCVAVGTAKAGEDCERDHCGKNLVCLGTPGQRECFVLCHTQTAAECAQGQKCKTGLQLFKDPAIGYCE
jgi:hypothetical protein